MDIPERDTFSPKEVASMLGHDSSTVSRWCQEGKIAARKPFGRWAIARDAVVALLVAFGISAQAPQPSQPPVSGRTAVPEARRPDSQGRREAPPRLAVVPARSQCASSGGSAAGRREPPVPGRRRGEG